MLGAIKLTDLATLGLLEQATSGWIWSETGAQTRHTAERWPAPGMHAHTRRVVLAHRPACQRHRQSRRKRPSRSSRCRFGPWAVAVHLQMKEHRDKTSENTWRGHFVDTHLLVSISLDSAAHDGELELLRARIPTWAPGSLPILHTHANQTRGASERTEGTAHAPPTYSTCRVL